jgi:hypothetical protein
MPRKKAEKSDDAPKHKRTPKTSKVSAVFIELVPEKYFILCNGQSIKDFKDLADTLETIGDDIFYYHVTAERNDFANWIRDVFEEHDLAETIRSSKSRHEMMASLYKHLYNKITGK